MRCFFLKPMRAALLLMVLTMLCWGSWANTLKLCPGYRFQLFYWDYAIGLTAGAIFWGLTAGSHGQHRDAISHDLCQATTASHDLCGIGWRQSSTSRICCWWRQSM